MAHRDDRAVTVTGIAGVLEAAVYAGDLDAAEDFYGTILGLERIVRAGNRHVFFRAGPTVVLVFNPDETARPAANPALPVPAHGATGPGHICFSVPDGVRLDALAARLERQGVAIEADFRWPNGARSVYVRDPAGNSVEFAEPRLWDPS
ncbi:MAG: VOC family protein [Rhodobacteraceae bacterium]|nr:VOC family protein [Paracoccaceae bacterium]